MRGARALLPFFGLLALAAALRANGPPGPVLRLSRDGGHLVFQPPAAVISGTEVRPRLTTGLTTSFTFQVSVRDATGRVIKGGARIDVRYELWDEVFLVRGSGVDGRRFEATLPSFERLLAWWRELEVPVAGIRAADRRAPWSVKVAARVIPFSQSEQRDAQRWLSDSVKQRATVGSESDGSSAERSTGVLDLLVGTSIQRRALVGYDWNLTFAAERRPEAKP